MNLDFVLVLFIFFYICLVLFGNAIFRSFNFFKVSTTYTHISVEAPKGEIRFYLFSILVAATGILGLVFDDIDIYIKIDKFF